MRWHMALLFMAAALISACQSTASDIAPSVLLVKFSPDAAKAVSQAPADQAQLVTGIACKLSTGE